ncbi:hypothetical protein [Actinoallomurus liliacearum]
MILSGRRSLALAAAVLPTLALTTVLASSTPASASGPSCGSRYALRSTQRMYINSSLRGYLKVYYNSSNGYNCALVVRKGSMPLYSAKLKLCVYNKARTKYGSCKTDGYGKRYSWYAGPVYVYAPHRCLYVYGSINTNSWTKVEVTGKKVLCG